MKLVVTPPALAELQDAAAFYALKGSVELGLAFVADELRILAVAHHRRRPGYWTDRK